MKRRYFRSQDTLQSIQGELATRNEEIRSLRERMDDLSAQNREQETPLIEAQGLANHLQVQVDERDASQQEITEMTQQNTHSAQERLRLEIDGIVHVHARKTNLLTGDIERLTRHLEDSRALHVIEVEKKSLRHERVQNDLLRNIDELNAILDSTRLDAQKNEILLNVEIHSLQAEVFFGKIMLVFGAVVNPQSGMTIPLRQI